ncbi:hypothetical protein BM221_010767 [Beauveria bassiana]|uniref:Uncharacterized protein n=1 Tax=Beauveria bassiana TaxID=176275 RepID=A0A2N6N816_BEABA|nr:hypothetical protein BM221_010767 [Beauveria bassiana]
MLRKFRGEDETPASTESRPEAGPTTVEARLDNLMQENGNLKRQVNYFEVLLGDEDIFRLSKGLRAVVSEFNGRLESSNRQWMGDERHRGGDPRPPTCAAAPKVDRE